MKQSNGTIVVYPIKDMLHGRMFQVSVKGLDGKVETSGRHRNPAESQKAAKQWASFTGFPITSVDTTPTSYWLGVGVGYHLGRGQFEVIARSYVEAVALANTAQLGEYPIQSVPFNSLPILGTLEA